jgi:hypothetical protein
MQRLQESLALVPGSPLLGLAEALDVLTTALGLDLAA